MANFEPEGEPVSTTPSKLPSLDSTLHGQYITLRPLQVSDAPLLFPSLAGPENAALWTYIPCEPILDLETLTKHLSFLCDRAPGSMFFPYVLLSKNPAHVPANLTIPLPEEGLPVGVTTLMSISPANHVLEIGHVVYSPRLQRSAASTEATYLLMKYAFEELGYQRVEWKCNDRNLPSSRAAVRLGFVYEGTFRRHMVVKGRRRDTWWGSVVVEEWEGVRGVLEAWLDGGNFEGPGGRQRERIEEVRGRLQGEGKGL